MTRIVARCLVIAASAAGVAAATSGADAQAPAPCAAGTASAVSLQAEDFEARPNGALTATHTINLELSLDETVVDEDSIQWSGPPGATLLVRGRRIFADLLTDAPGAVPVTVAWTQDDGSQTGSQCSASFTTTLQLQAPTPLALGKAPKRLAFKYAGGWSWTIKVGRYANRSPLEVRARGVGRGRLPGAQVPFKVAHVALRGGDKGFGRAPVFHLPRWRFRVRSSYPDAAYIFVEANVNMKSLHDKPLGFEIVVLQAGRQLIHVRQAGKCDVFGCTFRTVKVEH